MATDLAEVIGGAVALNLLFDVPLLLGGPDHRCGLDDPAHGAEPARRPSVRVRDHRAHGHHHDRLRRRCLRRTTGPGRSHRRDGPRSRTPVRSCWPRPSSGRPSCRTRSTRTPRSPATVSVRQPPMPATRPCAPRPRASAACSRHPLDVSIAMVIAGSVNLCILLLAAANLAGVEGTDSLEGAHAALAAGLGPVVATSSPWVCSPRAWPRLGRRLRRGGDHARPAASAHPAARASTGDADAPRS